MTYVRDNDRPFIDFEVVRNKGEQGRPDVTDESGKVVRAGRPAEQVVVHRKALVDRVTNSPFVWVEPSWVLHRLEEGWKPIAVGNMDKLPANYPPAWRAILEAAVGQVTTLINLSQQAGANQAQLQAMIAEMQAKLEAQEQLLKAQKEIEDAEATTETTGKKSGKGNRLAAEQREGALAEAGEAANA